MVYVGIIFFKNLCFGRKNLCFKTKHMVCSMNFYKVQGYYFCNSRLPEFLQKTVVFYRKTGAWSVFIVVVAATVLSSNTCRFHFF